MLPWEPVAMASLSYFTSKLSSLEPSLHVTTFLSWSIASASAEKYLFCTLHTASCPLRYLITGCNMVCLNGNHGWLFKSKFQYRTNF